MKKAYRVILPVEIDGVVYEYDQVVELELERALEYSHALIPLDVVKGDLYALDEGVPKHLGAVTSAIFTVKDGEE